MNVTKLQITSYYGPKEKDETSLSWYSNHYSTAFKRGFFRTMLILLNVGCEYNLWTIRFSLNLFHNNFHASMTFYYLILWSLIIVITITIIQIQSSKCREKRKEGYSVNVAPSFINIIKIIKVESKRKWAEQVYFYDY